ARLPRLPPLPPRPPSLVPAPGRGGRRIAPATFFSIQAREPKRAEVREARTALGAHRDPDDHLAALVGRDGLEDRRARGVVGHVEVTDHAADAIAREPTSSSVGAAARSEELDPDRKSTRLNS